MNSLGSTIMDQSNVTCTIKTDNNIKKLIS